MKNHLYEIFNHWGKDIWVYSDPHFGDIDLYKLRFPDMFPEKHVFTSSDVIEGDEEGYKHALDFERRVKFLDEMQIKNINSKAGRNSTLIILGDVGDIESVKKLRAKYKILIMGNHDKGASNYKRDIVSTSKIICWRVEFNGIWPPICLHEKITIEEAEEKFGNVKDIFEVYEEEDNLLFDEVYNGPLMINDRLILSHEPIFPTMSFLYNIHGHVHNKKYKGDNHHLNMCAEAIKYMPVSLNDLIKKGILSKIKTIHRLTIDIAKERK